MKAKYVPRIIDIFSGRFKEDLNSLIVDDVEYSELKSKFYFYAREPHRYLSVRSKFYTDKNKAQRDKNFIEKLFPY